jgi:hypothetical protein
MVGFPSPFVPDVTHRAGRMMAAGRVKVTMTDKRTNEHFTVLFKSFADNRDKQFDPEISKRWAPCFYEQATHVFVEIPNAQGGWNDKIGTFYPKSNRWYDADNADTERIEAACLIAQWIAGMSTNADLVFQEAIECGVCGLELSDPVSIARGIGPTCYGRLTGSQHQVKNVAKKVDEDDEYSYDNLGITDAGMSSIARMIQGMSEEQLETMRECLDTRLQEVVQMRKDLVAEVRGILAEEDSPKSFSDEDPESCVPGRDATDRSFMGR